MQPRSSDLWCVWVWVHVYVCVGEGGVRSHISLPGRNTGIFTVSYLQNPKPEICSEQVSVSAGKVFQECHLGLSALKGLHPVSLSHNFWGTKYRRQEF